MVTIKDYIMIDSVETLRKNYLYRVKYAGTLSSPYMASVNDITFIDYLRDSYEKDENRNKDNFNAYYRALHKTFEYFYDNNKEWRDMVIDDYAQYHYTFVVGFDDEGNEIRKYLKDIENEAKKRELVIAKLIGTAFEYHCNSLIYSKLESNGFDCTPFIQYFNHAPNFNLGNYERAELWIVEEQKDKGTDALIVFYDKNEKVIGAILIQFKYRSNITGFVNKYGKFYGTLNIYEQNGCYDKLHHALTTAEELCDVLEYEENVKNFGFITMFNGETERIITEPSYIHHTQHKDYASKHMKFVDLNEIKKLYNNKINDATVKRFIRELERLNSIAKNS